MFVEQKFRKFALSNFSAWETVYIHNYMSSKDGYVVPTIYEGMYNALTRQVEDELFPALRKLKMKFYAYNPLAGGMLTGKYIPTTAETPDDDEEQGAGGAENNKDDAGGRFAGTSFWAQRYRERYQQKEQFEALKVVRNALGGDTAGMADASLRWIRHHSKLNGDDGIIIGASKFSHYRANMESLAAGPLSDDIVKAFDEAARLCQNVCPAYSRGYSGSALDN